MALVRHRPPELWTASRARGLHRSHEIPWTSPGMREVETDVRCAVQSNLNVLITGEAGVGKRATAYRIYRESSRAAAPLARARVTDAAEWPLSLGEVFKGARPHGTVLLWRVDRMSPILQARLEQCIDGAAVEPGAGTRTHHGVRILTTARAEVLDLVGRGRFADRLFYQLNAIHVRIPPLRERAEDIPALLQHFLHVYGQEPVPRISAAACQRLVRHTWPGNVRELRAVAWSVAQHGSRPYLQSEDLPPGIGP